MSSLKEAVIIVGIFVLLLLHIVLNGRTSSEVIFSKLNCFNIGQISCQKFGCPQLLHSNNTELLKDRVDNSFELSNSIGPFCRFCIEKVKPHQPPILKAKDGFGPSKTPEAFSTMLKSYLRSRPGRIYLSGRIDFDNPLKSKEIYQLIDTSRKDFTLLFHSGRCKKMK